MLAAASVLLAAVSRDGAGAGGLAPPDDGAGTMRTVVSRDGTRIAVWRSGAGPALLLVHGATADHGTTWRLVRPELEARFTVWAMDRRGRGASDDGPAYALAREAEDVAAVVEAIGGPVDVVGHSYGALCALEAALLTTAVRRLVLYEGVPIDGAGLYPPDVPRRLAELLAAGDVEGMLVALYREVAGIPQEEVELLRAQGEAWAVRLRNAPTVPRELAEEQAYRFDATRFAGLRAPTLLVVGSDSPQREVAHARHVASALPDARVAVLPGQQHVAMHTAPGLFVREVVGFLSK